MLSKRFVPSEGPDDAKIMFVGEAPGEEEEDRKRPFIGRAGQFLERSLSRVGLQRKDVFLTNLCRYRPQGNKFEFCLNTQQLEEGLALLKREIEEINPNVIVALGNWPMWFLTGCGRKGKPGGISYWRGSLMPCTLVENYKVLITYHPAFLIRPDGYELRPIFQYVDLPRAVEESSDKEIKYPQYDEFIDPPFDELVTIAQEMCQAEWVAVDIETFSNERLACIGFADSPRRALCLTYRNESINWPIAQEILASPAKKIFQFGFYDTLFLHHFYEWEVRNWEFDTFLAANHLMPGFPKKLDFLASIYTRFPYYKEDRKDWKVKGDIEILWKYNCKDVIATYEIAMKQMEELREEGLL